MNKKQIALILGLAIAGIIVPNFTVGLALMSAAVGAFLSVVLQ
jgi:hypothetical protein